MFAPIAVPMVVGLLKELLGWWRRRKSKKAKGTAEVETLVKESGEKSGKERDASCTKADYSNLIEGEGKEQQSSDTINSRGDNEVRTKSFRFGLEG